MNPKTLPTQIVNNSKFSNDVIFWKKHFPTFYNIISPVHFSKWINFKPNKTTCTILRHYFTVLNILEKKQSYLGHDPRKKMFFDQQCQRKILYFSLRFNYNVCHVYSWLEYASNYHESWSIRYGKVYQSIFRIIVLTTLKLDYVDHNKPNSGCSLVNQ